VVLRSKGEGSSRVSDEELVESLTETPVGDDESPPIIRARRKRRSAKQDVAKSDDTPVEEPPTQPKPRPKKKPSSETWDF
jgi:hypothetical protein